MRQSLDVRAAQNVYVYFQAEDGIRDADVTGVQRCALPISLGADDWRYRSPDFTGLGLRRNVGRAIAPVVRTQRGGPLEAERARQEARLHWAVDDDPRAVCSTPGKLRGRNFPADRRKRRLQGVHMPEALGRVELRHVVIGEPDRADLPFFLQLQQGPPVVFERGAVLGRPMHLVRIDALDIEPAE